MTAFGKDLAVESTPIPGLLVLDLPVHGDSRGWFKENWHRQKLRLLGVPDLGPVQNNVSFNSSAGTTRGIHAEPWDKYISVATGRIFCAWVDLRDGPTFGTVVTAEVDPSRAVFVPQGVGNGFQTLEPNTAYTYLVNDHYSPDGVYTSLHPGDATVGIDWPIPLDQAELSAKDLAQGPLSEVVPVQPRKILVIGCNGQLGRALRSAYEGVSHVEYVDLPEFDLSSEDFASARSWREYSTIINAAAYTAVDAAETAEGRVAAWAANVAGVANLARVAAAHRLTVVHVSTDYVFDGSSARPYLESDLLCPLGVYGQTKAAGDHLVANVGRHYIVRTSWVIGDGRNFVRTMLSLADRGVDPSVVDDQIGRLTFTSELARAIRHLVESRAPYGTYNVTGSGPVTSWADVARRVFELAGHDPGRVSGVSTAEYFSSATNPVAPRPLSGVLDLEKVESTGFVPVDAGESLAEYVRSEARAASGAG